MYSFFCLTYRAGVVALAVLLASCHDNSDPKPTLSYTLEVRQGDGQTDTIGHLAHDTVVVRALHGTRPLVGYTLRYESDVCNQPSTFLPYRTDATGQGRYRWRLTSVVGPQELRVHLLDSAGVERATATLKATAVRPTRSWHPAACLPGGVGTLVEQPSGRLVAAASYSVFASNDMGVSWQLLNFPRVANLTIDELLVVGPTELVARASVLGNGPGTGLYYSVDNGQTWQLRTSSLRNDFFTDAYYTRNGQLLLSSQLNGLQVSTDKGLTWQPVPLPVPAARAPFTSISEAPAGDMYLLDYDGKIFHSVAGLSNWQQVQLPTLEPTSYVYADPSSSYVYVATSYGIYRSANQGASWLLLRQLQSSAPYIPYMVRGRLGLYFVVTGQGLILARGGNFGALETLTRRADGTPWGAFALMPVVLETSNGTLLVNGQRPALGEQIGLYYNQQP